METLVGKEQMHEEVGETKESALQVHGHGWFRIEETPTWMSQPVEVELHGWLDLHINCWVCTGNSNYYGPYLGCTYTTTCITSNVCPCSYPNVLAPMQKEVSASTPLSF